MRDFGEINIPILNRQLRKHLHTMCNMVQNIINRPTMFSDYSDSLGDFFVP